MGEDFLRKSAKSYKRSTQKAVKGALPKPLLRGSEERTTTYPCPITCGNVPSKGTRLILHAQADGAVVVMEECRIVGRMTGEAALDASSIFNANPQACGVLAVEVTEADESAKRIGFVIANAEESL
jgi:hypothetical protein